jgi:hypothetical protein
MNCQTVLKNETVDSVYTDTNPNHTFNSFVRAFLNIFQASFPVKYKSMEDKNDWITQGIKISCINKNSLYAFIKYSDDPEAKAHYINP